MRIRISTIEDSAEIARLHRQTIRNINAKDYTQEIIKMIAYDMEKILTH